MARFEVNRRCLIISTSRFNNRLLGKEVKLSHRVPIHSVWRNLQAQEIRLSFNKDEPVKTLEDGWFTVEGFRDPRGSIILWGEHCLLPVDDPDDLKLRRAEEMIRLEEDARIFHFLHTKITEYRKGNS